jgi:transposase
MGPHQATTAKEAKAKAKRRTPRIERPASARRDNVRVALGYSLENAAPGNGLRLGDDLLAAARILAAPRRLDQAAPGIAVETTGRESAGFLACSSRQFLHSCRRCREKSEPNPTDRRRPGSKHHLLTDAQGIPLSLILTGANRHDVTQLLPLVSAIPPVAGMRGAPRRKPALIQADRAYHSGPLRRWLAGWDISIRIARRGAPHGSGLGKTRWVVERTIAWLHQFRCLRVRYERLTPMHEAFLKLGACIICWRFLKAA